MDSTLPKGPTSGVAIFAEIPKVFVNLFMVYLVFVKILNLRWQILIAVPTRLTTIQQIIKSFGHICANRSPIISKLSISSHIGGYCTRRYDLPQGRKKDSEAKFGQKS